MNLNIKKRLKQMNRFKNTKVFGIIKDMAFQKRQVSSLEKLINEDRSLSSFIKPSFSQMGEDIAVKFIFDSLKIEEPSYIDIGANHPWRINNTALLYINGSRGINIEPNPVLFNELLRSRPEDINLNVGIGNYSGIGDYYHLTSNTLSSFSKEEAEIVVKIDDRQRIEKVEKIKVVTLETIISEYCQDVFPNFLNVDAEGVDDIIIRSIDFGKTYPKVICVETAKYSISGVVERNEALVNFLKRNGYIVFSENVINTVMVREKLWAER